VQAPDANPARQRAHQLLLDALTHAIRDIPGGHMPVHICEELTARMLDDLALNNAAVHGPHGPFPADQPSTLAAVADRLHAYAGPEGASRTVEIDRTELHALAAVIDRRAHPARPFLGDLLDYTELSTELVGWRALIGVLATTGTTVSVPATLMPPAAALRIVEGWTLHADTRPDTEAGHVVITADPHPLPALEPTPGCTAANDPRTNVFCRGPAHHTISYLDGSNQPTDTSDPVCSAHAWALHRRAARYNIKTMINNTSPADPE
jgi:hypothetical protein